MGDRRKVGSIASLIEDRSVKLQSDVVRYYRALARKIASEFIIFGLDGVLSAINNAEVGLTNSLIDRGGQTADAVGNKQLNIIESRVKKKFHVDFAQQLQFFLAARALRTSSLISGTDRAQASAIITTGLATGLTNIEIAGQLRLQFTSIATAYRAARIARTETSIAASEAQDRSARESDVELVKEWVSISDDRTRANHRSKSVDGQIREIDGTFQVGFDTMKGPHDLSASAGNVINCRCVLNYIPKSIL